MTARREATAPPDAPPPPSPEARRPPVISPSRTVRPAARRSDRTVNRNGDAEGPVLIVVVRGAHRADPVTAAADLSVRAMAPVARANPPEVVRATVHEARASLLAKRTGVAQVHVAQAARPEKVAPANAPVAHVNQAAMTAAPASARAGRASLPTKAARKVAPPVRLRVAPVARRRLRPAPAENPPPSLGAVRAAMNAPSKTVIH